MYTCCVKRSAVCGRAEMKLPRRLSNKIISRLSPWLLTIFVLIVWEAICKGFDIKPFLFPAPSLVWKVGVELADPIMMHAFHTLMTTLAGFAIAVVFGAVLGMLVGSSPAVYKALYPLMVGFNS